MDSRDIALALVVGWVGLVPASGAEAPVALGPEFEIGDDPADVEAKPQAAADSEGGFVVVWEAGWNADGDSYGVLARRFEANGAPVGSGFVVNEYTTGLQVFPDVARLANGDFVVVWGGLYGQDGDQGGVFGRRFDSAASPVGGEFRVHSATSGDQHDAAVLGAADGGFLVVWDHDDGSDHEIRAARFDSDGGTVGGELVLSDPSGEDDFDPRAALLPDGGFVAVWERTEGDGSGKSVHARFLSSLGVPLAVDFPVNVFTTWDQEDPEVAALADGGFAIAWESQKVDGSGSAAVARVFEADGTPRTGDVLVNLHTLEDQVNPSVAAAEGGGFVVVWETEATSEVGGREIAVRSFDGQGGDLGGEFVVNEIAAGDQTYAEIVRTHGERFLVVWTSDDCDGCEREAEGRLFDLSALFVDGFETGDTAAWSAGRSPRG